MAEQTTLDIDALLRVATIISHNDADVIAAMQECVRSNGANVDSRISLYQDDGYYYFTEEASYEEKCWLCLDCELHIRDYAATIDWKSEVEDILYNLQIIIDQLGLTMDSQDIGVSDESVEANDPDDPTWLALCDIAAALRTRNLAFGLINTESDSYTFFLINSDSVTESTLVESAQRIGLRILFDPIADDPI